MVEIDLCMLSNAKVLSCYQWPAVLQQIKGLVNGRRLGGQKILENLLAVESARRKLRRHCYFLANVRASNLCSSIVDSIRFRPKHYT